jgi:spore germination cell wall hydrolase CwlJ-like protein
LKFNRKVQYKGRTLKAAELAAQIQPEQRKVIDHGNTANASNSQWTAWIFFVL